MLGAIIIYMYRKLSMACRHVAVISLGTRLNPHPLSGGAVASRPPPPPRVTRSAPLPDQTPAATPSVKPGSGEHPRPPPGLNLYPVTYPDKGAI